jgi:hypothetical protein
LGLQRLVAQEVLVVVRAIFLEIFYSILHGIAVAANAKSRREHGEWSMEAEFRYHRSAFGPKAQANVFPIIFNLDDQIVIDRNSEESGETCGQW